MNQEIISMKDAKHLGLKHYFTASPCPSGHLSLRYVSNRACVGCIEDKNKSDRSGARERSIKWRKENDQKAKEQRKARYKANKDRLLALSKEYRIKNIAAYAAYAGKRRSSKSKAMPEWADVKEIEKIYREAKRISHETGVKHEVDHIVPLQGKSVCGLHIPANLQIITLEENRSKGNHVWPDMWVPF